MENTLIYTMERLRIKKFKSISVSTSREDKHK